MAAKRVLLYVEALWPDADALSLDQVKTATVDAARQGILDAGAQVPSVYVLSAYVEPPVVPVED